ncbi:MAG: M28 family peptidase [Acidobacteria bacterium]|nr:M28 family peptidase [Acidobacteriota bacterium]
MVSGRTVVAARVREGIVSHRWRLTALALAVLVAIGATQVSLPPASSTRFDAARLLRDLQVLSSDDMEGRLMGSAGNAKARAYLASRLQAAGLRPIGGTYEHPFVVPARGPGRPPAQGVNLVGMIDGTRQPRRYVVVSAHYDHVGVRGGQVFNGADDNASGAAALIAVTEYFRAHPPLNALLVVAFDGEESGLLGSRAFVRAPPVDRGAILIDINADMLGRDPNDELFVVGAARQPFLRPHIERVAVTAPVRLRMGHEDPTGRTSDDWTEDSDQFAFLEAGIPAIYVGVEDEPFHHQPADDFETIDHGFYVRAVETLIALVEEFDRRFTGATR